MRFGIFQESRRGTRKINQDRVGYCYSRDALLMVLADGMGGHLHGEVASHICLREMFDAFRSEARPALADPAAFLQLSIRAAHRAITRYSMERDFSETPRTTCVACVVQEGMAHWAHVGDSRLYHLRAGQICARTRDHSRVQLLVDTGRLPEEAANAHPERNRVFNCLGSLRPPRVELSGPSSLCPGDTLLLCSDGLWNPLSPAMITQAFEKPDLISTVPALFDLAEKRAGNACDNLSAVAMTWSGEALFEVTDALTTGTLELDIDSTRMDICGYDSHKPVLTDEEIERSIQEIRDAIRRTGVK